MKPAQTARSVSKAARPHDLLLSPICAPERLLGGVPFGEFARGRCAGFFILRAHGMRTVRIAILCRHHSEGGPAVRPLDAAYHVVHDYEPSGAESLAPRLGKSSTQLSHEVKPPPGSLAKLGLVDAVKITDLTGDMRILHAFAEALGHRCVQVSIPEIDNAGSLLEDVRRFSKEASEAMAAIHQAIADGKLTENEIRRCEKEIADVAPVACSLVARMRSLAAEASRLRAVKIA